MKIKKMLIVLLIITNIFVGLSIYKINKLEKENYYLLNDNEKYLITLSIRKDNIKISESKFIKNSTNDIQLKIPVDKEYFFLLEEGDILKHDIRFGSLDNMIVEIINKEII